MEELGLDPLDLGNLDLLRPKLRHMLVGDKIYAEALINSLNDKQLFDKLIESRIEVRSQKNPVPVFIMNHPLLMSPLAKSHAQGRSSESRGAEFLAERFELFVHGMEVVNAYSEQNCPLMQAKAFAEQAQYSSANGTATVCNADEELHRNDMDFVEALEYGMAPTAGWGCGIDRLSMLLCGAKNIREVILFPMHRTSCLASATSHNNRNSSIKSNNSAAKAKKTNTE